MATYSYVYGLMRNSRDFDFLAHGLERDFRVVCMDVVGRGRSDWLPQNVSMASSSISRMPPRLSRA
jgi:hypothetical protein